MKENDVDVSFVTEAKAREMTAENKYGYTWPSGLYVTVGGDRSVLESRDEAEILIAEIEKAAAELWPRAATLQRRPTMLATTYICVITSKTEPRAEDCTQAMGKHHQTFETAELPPSRVINVGYDDAWVIIRYEEGPIRFDELRGFGRNPPPQR